MALRIAHLVDTISNNGVTRVVLSLTESMVEQGVDNKLLYFKTIVNQDLADQFQCEVNLIELPPIKFLGGLGKSKWAVLPYSERDSAVVDAWVAENAIDFVFVHGRPILRFFRMKTPHAVVAHNTKSRMFLPGPLSPRGPVIRKLVKEIYSSQPIVTVSEGIRQDFIRQFGIDPELIQTIYNPIDINRIRRLSGDTPDLKFERPYFVAAGSARKVKRFDVLIRAFAKCRVDADLVILGSGTELDKYRKLASQLGISDRLHLPGYQLNPYSYFKRALALVVSSDFEGLPTGIIEALACGIPVVSTDCPSGPSEILTGDMAEFLVPVRDVDALSRAMERVIEHPYRYPEKLFERFQPSKVAREYERKASRYIHK